MRKGDVACQLVYAVDGDTCWICELPLGNKRQHSDLQRSRDHVIPKHCGGAYMDGNVRWAHRWCNSSRGHFEVTEEMRIKFREKMLEKHKYYFKKRTGSSRKAKEDIH